jgi:crotonobetainyl-CoA:carnitine CoA-transferase CaiB-like acyl-CoA transferase
MTLIFYGPIEQRVHTIILSGLTIASRTHGADVLWVTSPNLPTLPDVDCDVQRGKRTIQLDLRTAEGKRKLLDLAKDADVFLQGYRPGSLAALGISPEVLRNINPSLIIANLSAYGPNGPWASRRGFDSIVQTCSGMNVAEAERFGGGTTARPLPCQALDHGSGYLLATGIIAAVHKRATDGGSYVVDVSLAGTMNYLCSLGQYEGRSGFECPDIVEHADAAAFVETRTTQLGELTAVRHAANINGLEVGWDIMPKPLGSDDAVWLSA